MADQDKPTTANAGPVSYRNWHAERQGVKGRPMWEIPLHTDSHIIGTVTLGPYHLINTVPCSLLGARSGGVHSQDPNTPALMLRIYDHLPQKVVVPDMKKTDASGYHGGGIEHEVAALVSLCFGIRLKPGGISRFWTSGGDPAGTPVCFNIDKTPVLLKPRTQPPILPCLVGERRLEPQARLLMYPNLGASAANVLIRAARLYQDAVWVAETEPQLAWLLFVSSAEAAAGHWVKDAGTPTERFTLSRPKIAEKLLECGGEQLLDYVAEELSDSLGATKKFLEFMQEFMPPPPNVRPELPFQVSWASEDMKRSLKKVYYWRCKALHEAIAFPAPMCMPALPVGNPKTPSEVLPSTGAAVLGNTWRAEDTPMLLSTFEYILRNALLSWWDMLVSRDASK